MRRIVILSLLIISVFVVYGATNRDSIQVYFALNKAEFNPTLNNNAASMTRFIDGIAAAVDSGTLDRIDIRAYASPDGPFLTNDKLSINRCNAIAQYITAHAGIAPSYIHTYPGGIAWDGLRALVLDNASTPSRDEVLRVLNRYVPDACTDKQLSEQCMAALKAIDAGRAYRWMLQNLFPKLRYSLAVYSYTTPDVVVADTGIEPDTTAVVTPVIVDVAPADTDDTLPVEEIVTEEPVVVDEMPAPAAYDPLHRLAIKTNLLYYGILLPNLEVEWLINRNWSIALEGDVAWWGRYKKDKSYRLAIVSPEVKRWFRPRAPWHGFYVGAFAGVGLYDFLKDSPGYRGEGVMGGLSVGYMWPISRNLSFEAAIGAGYLYTRYKEYKPLDGHHVYQRTKDLHYFGPLKVKFSLVWRLWDINKPSRRSTNQSPVPYEK